MSKVHILPEDVVSKIAAGEIIERPASVVKELLENAIDAQADSIELSLKDAGKSSIRIKDNGTGIEKDDLDKIFLRHATSKIKSVSDLESIFSLGFRGEALYSIAAISDIILQTKTEAEDSGWEVHIRGNDQLDLKPCTFNRHGTEILINELFYNTPARKKFLKSNTTEINQVLNTFIPYCLLHPNIRFKLTHQGKDLIDLAPTDQFKSRTAHTLNFDEKNLLEINTDTPDGHNLGIKMLLGNINIKRTRRDMQFIFINNRPVQNKSISYHLNQIYRLLMPEGSFPFFALFIQMPTEELDVNIHPTKREVKIKNERPLVSVLRSLAENALMTEGQIKLADSITRDYSTTERALMGSHQSEMTIESTISSEAFNTESYSSDDYAFPQSIQMNKRKRFNIPIELFERNKENLQGKLEAARYVGSFMNKYLLFETGNDSDRSLLLVDQHAAAERITFEQLIRQMNKGTIEVQNLLSPILIKCSPQELLFWEEAKDNLEKMGLSSSLFDKETVAIHTQPLLLKDTEKAVRLILSGEKIEKADFETLARRACRSSIMAGDHLSKEQAEFQREQLLQCLDPFTCPHGRPTIVEISESFLDKQFLRT